MSGIKWTREQMEAISENGCNLLVAAAAGAGKTAVLVERIIRKITNGETPVDIDRLLVVTYTNAAAAEMRQRIGDALERALDENPGCRELQSQLTLLNRASITTIHSFCLEVIRNNFHCIDIDPNFRVADETEAVLMKMEALEELFDEKYEAEDPDEDFLRLVECYGGSRDDRMLQDMVLVLYEFVQSHPWPEEWLRINTEAFNIPPERDMGGTKWAQVLMESIRIELSGLLNLMQKAAGIIRNSDGLGPYLTAFTEDISNIRGLIERCGDSWDGLYDAFSGLEFPRLSRCGKDADRDRQEQVKGMRDEAKKRLMRIKKDIFSYPSSEVARCLNRLYPLMGCLSRLVVEFGQRYTAKKRERSLLDFSDLEHLCLEILTGTDDEGNITPSQVALAFRERFEEILVDEYQDSNLVQEVIIGMVSRKDSERPNVFVVGDVKQSIYRFRQARPELFMEKYNTYSGETGSRNRKILLYRNFRSREEIIHAVNFIFKQIMSRNIGELDYTAGEALNLGADYDLPAEGGGIAGGGVELHILDVEDKEVPMDEDEEETEQPAENGDPAGLQGMGEEPDNIQSEAIMVARRIKELVVPAEGLPAFKVYDNGLKAYRDVEYRDIVVLLRTTRNWAGVFMEELSGLGIPVYADTATGFFQTVEIKVVMSLLQVIDNPRQDIPMLSVLRSPIACFTPEQLIDIRLCDRGAPFYQAMKKLAREGDDGTAEKTREFLRNLEGWRDKASHMSTDELIWYLYGDTGYYSYVGAMPGGAQRQANLRMLFEKARQYEETSYKGLFNFINFIDRLKGSAGDMGSAKVLGENENVVRIMSIHKSKGLEFPVVIVAGCGKGFNFQDTTRSILLHQDLGFGPDYVDYERRISFSTVPKQALKYKIRLETLSEEMRILYVAFTRAKEKLIITGCVKDLKGTAARWQRCLYDGGIKLPEYEMMTARNFLDWIGPALVRHKDCGILRQAAAGGEGFHGALLEDGSLWEVNMWSKADIMAGRAEAALGEENLAGEMEKRVDDDAGGRYREEIANRLGWEYPYRMSAKFPVKLSVTEMKRRSAAEFSEEYLPAEFFTRPLAKKPMFLEEEKGLDPAQRGTVLHFVMQHLDLKGVSGIEDIEMQVGDMVSRELLTVQEAETVDAGRIERFLRSPLGIRVRNAEGLKREVPFNLEIRCREVYKDLPEYACGDETILLQGVIDCYFEEDGDIVLVDYKTDYVPGGGLDEVRERYRMQMEYYAMALERITGKRVRDKYIYLFWNGEVIEYA